MKNHFVFGQVGELKIKKIHKNHFLFEKVDRFKIRFKTIKKS